MSKTEALPADVRRRMAANKIVSSDSHMTEPPRLWEERIEKAYRDRAPKYIFDEKKNSWMFSIDGQTPRNVNVSMAVGQKPEDYKEFFKKGIDSARPGGWDPGERLKDMANDGIYAAVLYTSRGFHMFRIEDAGYQEACFRAYNDWIAEFCSYDPQHLIGVAMISLYNIEHAVEELRRCRKMGLKGGMIWGTPPEDLPFASPRYEPFFAAAEELEMPLTLHISTGSDQETKKNRQTVEIWNNTLGHISKPNEAQQSIAVLIFSGILDRHPRLKIVAAEYDVGWVPYFLQHADALHKRWSPMSGTKLSMLPSEFFHRQVFVTFVRDPIGMRMVGASLLRAENPMWCDDYPHGASTWPHSLEVIAKNMAELSESDRWKIIRDNAAILYGIDLN